MLLAAASRSAKWSHGAPVTNGFDLGVPLYSWSRQQSGPQPGTFSSIPGTPERARIHVIHVHRYSIDPRLVR
jgi:hypothetical protein